MKYKWL